MRLFFLTFVVSLLVISSTITSAYSANSWMTSSPPTVRHTTNNPGHIKICGDHKCGPFEDTKKSLQDKLKQINNTTISNKIKIIWYES